MAVFLGPLAVTIIKAVFSYIIIMVLAVVLCAVVDHILNYFEHPGIYYFKASGYIIYERIFSRNTPATGYLFLYSCARDPRSNCGPYDTKEFSTNARQRRRGNRHKNSP